MRRIFAKTISLMLVLGIFMSIPAWAETETEATPEPTPKPLKIEQYQFERDSNGSFKSVEADKVRNLHLLPVVGDTSSKNSVDISISLGDNKTLVIPANTFNDKLSGVVDNVITVKNESPAEGGEACYFRTLFAVESPDNGRDVVLNFTDTDLTKASDQDAYAVTKYADSVTINDTEFDIYVAVYQKELSVGEVAPPSLLQVYMPSEMTSEEAALYGESLELMIVSQAIQSANLDLDDAMSALGDAKNAFVQNDTLLAKLKNLIASLFTKN